MQALQPGAARVGEDAAGAQSLCDMLAQGFLPSTGSVSPKAVQWAKSYNLGWKWCTGGGRRSNNSKKVKQSHKLDGFGLLVLKTPDLQDMSYYLVVDRFSHSVCFSRLSERLHKTFR